MSHGHWAGVAPSEGTASHPPNPNGTYICERCGATVKRKRAAKHWSKCCRIEHEELLRRERICLTMSEIS